MVTALIAGFNPGTSPPPVRIPILPFFLITSAMLIHIKLQRVNLQNNKPLKAFEYKDKGSMATIGRNKAVVDLPKFHFHGVFAWFVWMFVHLFSLIGFKNKAVVFLNWVYNYIRFDREARLIMRPYKKRNQVSFTSDEL